MATLRISVRNGVGFEASRTLTVEVVREVERPPEPPRLASAGRRIRLGQILVEAGVITQEELRRALDEQRRTGHRIGVVIRGMGLGSQEAIAEALAQQLGIAFVRIDSGALDDELLLKVPEALARRHQVIPLHVKDNRLVLGMVDPLDIIAADDVYQLTGLPVTPAAITADDFNRALSQYPAPETAMEELLDEIKPSDGSDDEAAATGPQAADDAPIVRLANLILVQAVRQRASDIHIEPQERQVRVRFRVDGTLASAMTPPRHVHAALASRVKILANMNIAERRIPQDGRVDLKVDGREVRLRVSSVPTTLGEKIVIRILDRSNAAVEIGKLGLLPADAQRFDHMVSKPHGIILFTGPTGSGKTTSLYALLNRLNRPEVNIVTVEDPVEYQLPGINQVQVNPKAGLTFANGLRSFLRQDPDIIMVGEIRDEETARIAIHAALTGHLVLSTLHTNDAPGAVARLVDMGIEPFLVASSVIGVVAQRLVRVLCERCREAYTPAGDLLARLGLAGMEEPPVFYRAVGCEFCGGMGHRGRVGLFEVMLINPTIRELMTKHAPATEITQAALASGMRSLQDDGLVKVAAGLTSLEELRRVVFMQDRSPVKAVSKAAAH
jgi:type IV pilus assembly protein PilB